MRFIMYPANHWGIPPATNAKNSLCYSFQDQALGNLVARANMKLFLSAF